MDDGTVVGEKRSLEPASNGKQATVAKGGYSYVAPDGQTYWVTYGADENGFRPKSGMGLGENVFFSPDQGNYGDLKSIVGK